MRLSANPDDPDFRPEALTASVMLDGELLTGCITADEEAGTALCFVICADGRPACLMDDAEYATTVRHGTVEIILQDAQLT